jgi:hypothetical protein
VKCGVGKIALALGLSALALTERARAEGPEQQQIQAAAESLFLDGRKLMAAGKLEEACQRFAESRRIEPALGTTMNLARCYLKLGRTASAWLLYRDTAATSRALGQLDREEHARQELAAIEPELAKVVVEAEPALLSDPRVEVMLDDSRIPGSLLGSEVPVDPGPHRLVVRTPRAELWTAQVEGQARHTERVAIPHLEVPPDPVEPGTDAPPARSNPAGASAVKDTAPVAPPHWLTPRRKIALAFGGAATLAAGYAVFETFRAASANESSDPQACKRGTTCSDAEIQNRERAFDSARRADIAGAVSAACLLGAGALWLLGAPAELPVSAQSTGHVSMLTYRGTW